jgi:hypothetical protein
MYASHRRRRVFHHADIIHSLDGTLAFLLILLVVILFCVFALYSRATL